jgi:nitrate reductase beta subunit
MIYFLDEYLLAKNSSVEHAALKRLALFKQFKQPVKILTRDYDRLSVQTLRELGVAQTDVRNMFDYFQHVPADRPEKAVHNDEINLPTMDEVSVDANQSQVTNGDGCDGRSVIFQEPSAMFIIKTFWTIKAILWNAIFGTPEGLNRPLSILDRMAC